MKADFVSDTLEQALDEIAPFAVLVSGDGAVQHLGRSLKKILEVQSGEKGFFDLFTVHRPFALRGTEDIGALCGERVILKAKTKRAGASISLRTSIAKLDRSCERFLVLTSLGTEMGALVESLGLSDRDFAYADPTVDMLHMLKAQLLLLGDAQALANRLKKAKDDAEALAYTDALTGLPNRRALAEFLTQRISNGAACDRIDYLLHIDLDRFKRVNDTLGHAVGDAVLQRVTTDLKQSAGPNDFIARIGGDEFILILTETGDVDTAVAVGERLISQIDKPVAVNGQLATVGASIGIARIMHDTPKTIDTLLLEADLALYDAKDNGRGKVNFFSKELQEREARTQQLIRDIEPAIERREFVPFFQVQYDVATNSVLGAEVLGRWEHPQFGLLAPGDFLYVAERAQLVEKIDCVIYDRALDHFAEWQMRGIAPPHISFNITGRKLTNEGFVDRFLAQVHKRGLQPSQVIFELVETILFDGVSKDVPSAALKLHEAGFRLAIDDFGTGHASMLSLLTIPVSILKIDRSFIADIHSDAKKAMLAASIISIGEALDLRVIAEGTESPLETEKLLQLGCSAFQGYLFGKPQSATTFTESLHDANWLMALQELAQKRNAGFGSMPRRARRS